MNQILSTVNVNNKHNINKGGSKDVNSIIKFFAIILIVFGVFLIANSSYALYKNSGSASGDSNQQEQISTKPEIEVQVKEGTQLIVNISTTQPSVIDKVVYHWNDEEEQTVSGDGRTYMQVSKIDIPKGENTFTVIATDINGEETVFSDTYTLQSEISIDIQKSGNKVKIDLIGNNEIKTVAYKWDNEEVQTKEVNNKEYSFELDVSLGEHTLQVQAVDVNGNKEKAEKTVAGSTMPTVTIEAGNDCYVIKAHDDVALDRVEIETMSDGKITKMQADGKDFKYDFPLKEGDNYIKVTAYNSQGVQSKSRKAVWKK